MSTQLGFLLFSSFFGAWLKHRIQKTLLLFFALFFATFD